MNKSIDTKLTEAKVSTIKNKDEQVIASLILECIKHKILTDCSNDPNGRFFRFRFWNELPEYEIYFGALDKRLKITEHSGAERAIRASEFVTNLLKIIDTYYNCYIVPSDKIDPPANSTISKYIGHYPSMVLIDESKTRDGVTYSEDNISHELEVRIIAKIGNKYKRIIEVVTVQKNANGELSFKDSNYSRDGLPAFTDSTKGNIGDLAQNERERERARTLFELITGSDRNNFHETDKDRLAKKAENSRKILEALAASENSEFHKFITELGSKSSAVGQINVIPTSLFVGAAKEKTYYYVIHDEKGKKFEFALTWNQSAESFTDETPLYILPADDGSFMGLTYAKTIKKENGEERSLEAFEPGKDKIVLAHVIENGAPKAVCATVLHPENNPTVHSYKGVSNFAVSISKHSNSEDKNYVSCCYLKSEVINVDGGFYLKNDCAECQYSKTLHWRGNLEKHNFINSELCLQNGLIYLASPRATMKKRFCDCCETEYYAEDGMRYTDYKIAKTLLDGKIACDNCYRAGGSPFTTSKLGDIKLVEAFLDKKKISPSPDGRIFAKLVGGRLKEFNRGGNVFECSACKRLIYPNRYSGVSTCEICGNLLCMECKASFESNVVLASDLSSAPLRFCPSCPTENTPGVTGARIFDNAREANTKTKIKGRIYVDPAKTDRAYHCGFCGELVFDRTTPKKCDCCGRLIEASCYKNIRPVNEMRLCLLCSIQTTTGAKKDVVAQQRSEIENCDKLLAEEEKKLNWLTDYLKSEDALRTMLSQLPLKFRRYVDGNPNNVKIEIIYHSIEKAGSFKNLYAEFKFTVPAKRITYYFIINGKKIKFEA